MFVTNRVTYYFLFFTSEDPPIYTLFAILNKLMSLVVLPFISLVNSYTVKALVFTVYLDLISGIPKSFSLLWIMNLSI